MRYFETSIAQPFSSSIIKIHHLKIIIRLLFYPVLSSCNKHYNGREFKSKRTATHQDIIKVAQRGIPEQAQEREDSHQRGAIT